MIARNVDSWRAFFNVCLVVWELGRECIGPRAAGGQAQVLPTAGTGVDPRTLQNGSVIPVSNAKVPGRFKICDMSDIPVN